MRARVFAAAIVLVLASCSARPDTKCRQASRAQDWRAALRECEKDLTAQGARLGAARAAFYLQQYDQTLALAAPLLTGAAELERADAHALVGAAQFALGHNSTAQAALYADARQHLATALEIHERQQRPGLAGRDLQQLAGLSFKTGDIEGAIEAAARATAYAKAAHDARLFVYATVARVDLLRAIGQYDEAEKAAEAALAEATDVSDRALVRTKLALVRSESGRYLLARATLEKALREETATQSRPRQLQAIYSNLSAICARLGKVDCAFDFADKARAAGTDEFTYYLVHGSALEAAGQLDAAEEDWARAQAIHAQPESEWGWRLHHARARVAAARGRIDAAIELDRRAIARIGELATTAGYLGSTFVARHRAPHLHLLEILATREDWSGVLDTIGAMDAQALLQSTAVTDVASVSADPPEMLKREPVAIPAAKDVLAAWRGRHLVIVVAGATKVWRVQIVEGAISGAAVGEAARGDELARRLYQSPADTGAAAALGTMILPGEPTGRIDLLLIGSLSLIPTSALRGNHAAELVRVPGILPRPPTPPAQGRAIVLGNPTGDLGASSAEAEEVGGALAAEIYKESKVTKAVFEKARDARILHVAAHIDHDADGASIRLARGRITHREIAAWRRASGLVVLAGCASSVGLDDADNGSLAIAFLEAGAHAVLTTRWSIPDEDAARFMRDFYRQGGASDAVRGLHEAQRQTTAAQRTWAAFEVFVARPAPADR